MAFYYTLAWLNDALLGEPSGLPRAHRHHLRPQRRCVVHRGQTYNLKTGNVPYAIAGLPVANLDSFYYESDYAVRDPATGVVHTCLDMRAGCPAAPTPVP